MTEIPEHLLKRAAQRRAALSGTEAPADAAPDAGAPAAAGAPATAPAAAPAKKAPAPLPSLEPEAPKAVPDIPVVAAAKARRRVPYWATALLASLPMWAFIYVYSIAPPPAGENDPLAIGAEVYSTNGCAGCHAPSGAGTATGQKLNEGEVLATFPDPLTMVHWIRYGFDGHARPDGTYGAPDREGGVRSGNDVSGAMPGFDLSAEELAAVTIYVREGLSGGDPADDPNFNSELFVEDAAGLEGAVDEVVALGEGPDPDIASIEGAETEEG